MDGCSVRGVHPRHYRRHIRVSYGATSIRRAINISNFDTAKYLPRHRRIQSFESPTGSQAQCLATEALFVSNALDKHAETELPIANGIDIPTQRTIALNRPRTIGLDIRFDYPSKSVHFPFIITDRFGVNLVHQGTHLQNVRISVATSGWKEISRGKDRLCCLPIRTTQPSVSSTPERVRTSMILQRRHPMPWRS